MDGGNTEAGATPTSADSLLAPGPFAVATRDFTFVDSSRPTPKNGTFAGTSSRSLPVRVWYPAEALGPDGSPAPAPASGGPFPVVLYAHAFLGARDEASYLKNHLASHGYIIVAPEFPLSNGSAPGGPTFADIGDQPADLAFAISQVEALTGTDQSLADALDTSREGVAGISLGGTTSLLAAYHPTLGVPEVKVAVAMAPAVCALGRGIYGRAIPVSILGGTADEAAPVHFLEEQTLAFAPPPLTLVELQGGSHVGFQGFDLTPGATGNADTLNACGLLQRSVGCTLPNYPDVATKLATGVTGDGYVPVTCGELCSESFDQTMRATRQMELAKIVALAQFNATLRSDAGAAVFLASGLARAAADVRVLHSGDSPGPDGSTARGAPGPACKGPGEPCNTVVNIGPVVAPVHVDGPMPDGVGGTIVDGTYVITRAEQYADSQIPATFTLQETAVVAGGVTQVSGHDGPSAFTSTLQSITNGTSLELRYLCTTSPYPPFAVKSYTATPDGYVLYGVNNLALTWARQ